MSPLRSDDPPFRSFRSSLPDPEMFSRTISQPSRTGPNVLMMKLYDERRGKELEKSAQSVIVHSIVTFIREIDCKREICTVDVYENGTVHERWCDINTRD